MEWVILGLLAVLWLISPIILLVALVVARRQLREARRRLVAPSEDRPLPETALATPLLGAKPHYAPADLENLLLLRLELQRLHGSGAITEERCRQWLDDLDRLWDRHLRESGAQPENNAWRNRRALAWSLLTQGMAAPPGPPPWQPAVVEPPPIITTAPRPSPPPFKPPEFPPPPPVVAPTPAARRETSAPPAPYPALDAVSTTDWRPAAPTPLEKALHALSGWPRLIAPFLAQNIGWFIGGFCFIAGALFLIANTSGFINALVVFASLFSATAFLLWAGYQFRRKGAELVVASSMLLTLGMLLAPLDLAVAVRLIDVGGGGLPLAVGLLITAATLAAFAWAATLTSALMDRALPGRYARLLTALAAVQLAAPLAGVISDWRGLAALCILLLGLLGHALRTFVGEWLRQLFVDRRLTTYYAAGMLVYTTAVSFIHLGWIWPEPLPAGYGGPLLMALCGLLFPVDAALKEWVRKHAFLSRFSFVLYALSAVAVAVAVQATPAALLTLAMGALLYGWVTWRYRTLPPLYLLLGCVAGLYGFGVLDFLPPAWHGLASLPGLAALLGLARWAVPRSRAIALQCLVAFGLLLSGLTGWSLFWGEPGALGCATAALAALLNYQAVRLALALPMADPRWAYADFGVVALAAAAAAYAPAWTWFGWETRTAGGWLALAALWTGLGLRDRRQSPISRTVFIAGAQLNIALALTLNGAVLWPVLLVRWEPVLVLALSGALLLWLSLGLRRQSLFYGVLLVAAAIGVLVKHGHFPGPSVGLGEFALVPALWAALWWLDWRFAPVERGSRADDDPAPESPSLAALLRAPLEQAMALLWAVGLAQLSLRLLDGAAVARWPGAAGLAALTGLWLVGYFHRFRWVALPLLLGLAALLSELARIGLKSPWLGAAAVLYALLVWWFGVRWLAKPLIWRWARVLGFTTPDGAGGRQQVEDSLHICALLIAALPPAVSAALGLLGLPASEGLPALALSLLLFGLAGWRYQSPLHADAALATLTVGAWLIGGLMATPALFGIGQPLLNVLLSLGMALAALVLEKAHRAAPLLYWRAPLARVSGLLYGLALAGAVPLGFLPTDFRLPVLLALLCLALFPVTRPWPNAAAWRGLGLPVLLSVLVGSLADWVGCNARESAWLAMVWGYALWSGGNLLLPRWNACWPDWAVEPALWPLLGLASVLGGGVVGVLAGALAPATLLAVLALYLFLLPRNTAWPGVLWLAVAALTASGLLASGISAWDFPSGHPPAIALVWLNLLFLLIPLWRRHGCALAQRLRWRQDGLEPPLFWTPFAVLILLLARLLSMEAGGLLWDGAFRLERSAGALTGLALLLAATAGHAFKLRPERWPAQALLLALLAVIVAAPLDLAIAPAGLPLAVALWNGALLLAWRYGPRGSAAWRAALEPWLALLPAASVALLFVFPDFTGSVGAATLWVLAIAALARGGWRREPFQLQAGLLLALAGGYALWLTDARFTLAALIGLAPWCALQTVLLLLALMAVRRRLRAWLDTAATSADAEKWNRADDLERAVSGLTPWLSRLSLLWLGGHGYAVLAYQAGWGTSPWWFGVPADPLAAGAALLALAGLAAVQAWRWPDQPNWIYATALLLGLLAAYGRLIALGLTPFTPWDTSALLAAAAAAFLLHQFTGRHPLYALALLLPLLALATTPWQLASPWTGGTLLAAAVLYLSLASALRNPLPLYLGVLMLNGAIYLWAPSWAAHYGLWQFHVVPAAVSVLALLHLHRRELRPKVLNGARLAALSALYAGAGLDVFLRPELGLFALALALALAGVILGVALRIRAFLYAGVAFLVLNVMGQLLRFYPEQGLSRALILIGLGAAITAGMVAFNLKREAILRRIRIVRADLAQWE